MVRRGRKSDVESNGNGSDKGLALRSRVKKQRERFLGIFFLCCSSCFCFCLLQG